MRPSVIWARSPVHVGLFIATIVQHLRVAQFDIGMMAFRMRFIRPGTTLERFLSRPSRTSDTREGKAEWPRYSTTLPPTL
jgi:hypothetical protein